MRFNRMWFLLVLALLLAELPLYSQQDPCAPPLFKIYKEKNMFNEQQEVWLGEVMDERSGRQYSAIEDPAGDYLQKFGERLLAQLPPTKKSYTFRIIDDPHDTAFSVGGTRIYVSRQLIVFLKDEDELAGLLAHEIGHIFTHQRAIDVTRVFRKYYHIEQVGDRNDIFEKWNLVEDTWLKKHVELGDESHEEEEQQIADRIGLYAATRAGYRPEALAAFLDRLTENKGKKGNFFSDLFATTRPESKRVRLLINNAKPLPAECTSATPPGSSQRFLEWQKAVIGARLLKPKEKVTGVLSKIPLQPPLRGSLNYLQFSPDGNYILAQDESSVFVLSRKPLANLFRFDAWNPQRFEAPSYVFRMPPNFSGLDDQAVRFTPDSRSIVFYDQELRVEKWDIETRQRTSVHQVTVSIPGRCARDTLSSTGEVLACLRQDKDDLRLLLIDVATNATLYDKKIPSPFLPDFYDFAAQPLRAFLLYGPAWSAMAFSSDSRYFVLGSNKKTIVYDLQSRKEMPVTHDLHRYTSSRFIFTSAETIAALDPDHRDEAVLISFPAGEVQAKFSLKVNGQPLVNILGMEGRLIAPGRGAYLLISPAGRWPMAVFDLETKGFLLGYKSPGLALYSETVAGEEIGGRVTLFNLSDKKPLATVQLPFSPLPGLSSAVFSDDGKWLAMAGRTSGGVWNVETGERVLDAGTFTGGYFDHDRLIAIFHKLEMEPQIKHLDLGKKKEEQLYTVDMPEPKKKDGSVHNYIWQSGNLLIERAAKNELEDCIHSTCRPKIAARDIRTDQILWTREFKQYLPKFFYSQPTKTLTLLFESQDSVKAEVSDNLELKQKLHDLPGKNFANLVEILDPDTGKVLGDLFVETGDASVWPIKAIAAGDTVLIYDLQNRTHVYSLKTGAQKGKVFGRFEAITASGDKMLVENDKGECKLYDTATLQPLAEYKFPARVAHAEFMPDGALLLLSADQIIYRLNVTEKQQNAGLNQQ